jgi:hypothetical protein
MAESIHQLKIEVWVRENITQMGEQEFLECLERALLRYQQTGPVEPRLPRSREYSQHQRKTP